MELILHYIPYILLFAAATAVIYTWAYAHHAAETGFVEHAQFKGDNKSPKSPSQRGSHDPQGAGTRGKRSDREAAV